MTMWELQHGDDRPCPDKQGQAAIMGQAACSTDKGDLPILLVPPIYRDKDRQACHHPAHRGTIHGQADRRTSTAQIKEHMATFRKGHNARTVLVRRVKVVQVSTIPDAKITWMLTASDTITLRGIPALGKGVAGVIRGTSPGT